jgi:hypothetical protein
VDGKAETATARDRIVAALWRGAGMVVIGTLAVALWLSLLDFPSFVAGGDDLDASWQQALGHFLTHRFQAGADYLFTYGPLGYFYTTAYDPALFWYKFAWELAFKLLAVVVLVALACRLRLFVARAGLLLLLFLFLPEMPHDEKPHRTDAVYGWLVVGLALLPLLYGWRTWRYAVPCTAVLAALSLVKFNLLMLSVGAVAVLSADLGLHRGRRAGCGCALLYAAWFLALWLLLGQSLASLPRYLYGSLQISSGFVEGMALSREDTREVRLALVLLSLLAVTWLVSEGVRLHSAKGLLAGALLTFSLFLMWKQGFVRHDIHSLVFFNFTLLAAFAPAIVFADRPLSWVGASLVLACVAVAALGRLACYPEFPDAEEHWERREDLDAFVSDRQVRLASCTVGALLPWRLQAVLEAKAEARRQEDSLPEVKARVGREPIDLMSEDQGLLFLNDLNYRPRPVFQSYSAYTPYLQRLNADFYRSERAPTFVLLALSAIDDRLPASEEGPALLEVLARYRLALVERGYLLLQQRQNATGPSGEVVLERTVRFGERVEVGELSAGCQSLALKFEYSPLGSLRKLFYKPPPLRIELQLEGEAAPHRPFRIIPGMAETGFLLNPLLKDNVDVRRLYRNGGQRVRWFRILADDPDQVSYVSQVGVTVRALTGIPAGKE